MAKTPERQRTLIDQKDRGVRRWLVLGIHAAVFMLVIIVYPRLENVRPELLDTNAARFAVPAWGALILLHVFLTYLADIRFLVRRARSERIRLRLNRPAAAPPLAYGGHTTASDNESGYAEEFPQFTRPPAPTSRRTKKNTPPQFYEGH